MDNEFGDGWFGLVAPNKCAITIEVNNRPILVDVVIEEDKYTVFHGGCGVRVTDIISARVEISTLLRDHRAITDDEVEDIKHVIEDQWVEPLDALYLIEDHLTGDDIL